MMLGITLSTRRKSAHYQASVAPSLCLLPKRVSHLRHSTCDGVLSFVGVADDLYSRHTRPPTGRPGGQQEIARLCSQECAQGNDLARRHLLERA